MKVIRLYVVVESRTGRIHDGPFESIFGANEAATLANRIARENGSPLRYLVQEMQQ